jgi:hypothetical protein
MTRADYARSHGGDDICALKSQSNRLPEVVADVEAAVVSGLRLSWWWKESRH